MNKKIIIAIIAGIVALAVIITAAVLMIGKVDLNAPKDDTTSDASGVDGDKGDSTNKDDSSSDKGGSDSDKGHVNAEKEDAKKGDIVDVPIKVTKNPGMMAGKFVFEYDSKALEYVDYEEGDLLNEYEVNNTDGKVTCIISNSELKDSSGKGTVIVLQFKVKDGAKKGDYEIKYSSESQIGNLDEKYVDIEVEKAKITVK